MTKESENRGKTKVWQADNAALLRAARRIIRLYDLRQAKLMTVKPESIAQLIAQELNDGVECSSESPPSTRFPGRG